jgi:hypothetical protein
MENEVCNLAWQTKRISIPTGEISLPNKGHRGALRLRTDTIKFLCTKKD